MTCLLHCGSWVGSLAQILANVPATTNLCSPARRGDLFQACMRERELESTLRVPFVRKIFFGGNFSERVTNATRLSRSYFAGGILSVKAHDCEATSGIGIRQEVAFSLPRLLCEIIRLRVTLLDQDRQEEPRKPRHPKLRLQATKYRD